MEKNNMTILQKRSNNLWSIPTKEVLGNGEIAINTNYQSPSLFFKTFDDDNIAKEVITVDINALKNSYSLTLDLSDVENGFSELEGIENEPHIETLCNEAKRILTLIYPTEYDSNIWYLLPITIRFDNYNIISGHFLYCCNERSQLIYNSIGSRLTVHYIEIISPLGVVSAVYERPLANMDDINDITQNYFEFTYDADSSEYVLTHKPSDKLIQEIPAKFDLYIIDERSQRYKLNLVYKVGDGSTLYRGIYSPSLISTSLFNFRITYRNNIANMQCALIESKEDTQTPMQLLHDLTNTVGTNTTNITNVKTNVTSLQSAVTALNTFKNNFNVIIPKYSDGSYVDITNIDKTKDIYWYNESGVKITTNKLTSRTVLRVKAKNTQSTSTVDLYPVNYYEDYAPATNSDVQLIYSDIIVYQYANTNYYIGWYGNNYIISNYYDVVKTCDEPIEFTSGGNIKELLLQPNNTTFITTYLYLTAVGQTAPTANTVYLDLSRLNYGDSHTLYLYCNSSNIGSRVLPIQIKTLSTDIYSFASKTDTVKIKVTNICKGTCFEITNLNDDTDKSVLII